MLLILKILFGMGFGLLGALAWARVVLDSVPPGRFHLALCAIVGGVVAVLSDLALGGIGDPFVTKSLLTMTFCFAAGLAITLVIGKRK